LSCAAGDELELITKIDDDWLECRFPKTTICGCVPTAYCTIESTLDVDLPATMSTLRIESDEHRDAPSMGIVTCLWDYTPGFPVEIAASAGEQFDLLEYVDDEWSRVRNESLQSGLIATSFLDVAQPDYVAE